VSTPTRPALRWHGGKWRLAPWIIGHFPEHRVYVEPFGGAGSVLLRKPRVPAEIYNDLDGEVVNLFRVLRNRRQAKELERRLRLTPYAREEMEAAYGNELRERDVIERARRAVVRGFMSHGADGFNRKARPGFRGQRSGSGYFHAHDWRHWIGTMHQIVERLQGVVIENKDAFKLIEMSDAPDVLYYLDPPYVPGVRQERQRKVYAHEMDDAGHGALAELLHGLKGMVVLSGYHNPIYDREFKGWLKFERATYGEKAVKRTEVLWLNPAAAHRQQPARL
jgi:DNA adenine methylase